LFVAEPHGFPHLMLRAKAIQLKPDGVKGGAKFLAGTDLLGQVAFQGGDPRPAHAWQGGDLRHRLHRFGSSALR